MISGLVIVGEDFLRSMLKFAFFLMRIAVCHSKMFTAFKLLLCNSLVNTEVIFLFE